MEEEFVREDNSEITENAAEAAEQTLPEIAEEKPEISPSDEIPEVFPADENIAVEIPEQIANNTSNATDYDLVTVSPVEFSSFDEIEPKLSPNPKNNLDALQDVKMHITVELGRAKCSVKRILDFTKGSIVELNKVAGEQVELYANGKFVAYGEAIVIEDKFGLRVTSVVPQNLGQ